jgi:hypothetical protein
MNVKKSTIHFHTINVKISLLAMHVFSLVTLSHSTTDISQIHVDHPWVVQA